MCFMSDRKERKTEGRIVLDGRQRESIFLIHDLSVMPKNPSYEHAHCKWPIIAHAPITPSVESFELFYGNSISDPRIQSPSLLAALQVCCMQQGHLSFSFSPSQAHTLLYNVCILFWQEGREQGRSMSNTCCSFASPPPVLSSPSAQGNIWIKDLSIFPANKMY